MERRVLSSVGLEMVPAIPYLNTIRFNSINRPVLVEMNVSTILVPRMTRVKLSESNTDEEKIQLLLKIEARSSKGGGTGSRTIL